MSSRDPVDAELLQALRRDPQAVGVIYDRYAPRLVAHLRQHGANADIALDATQETFARLIVRGARVRPGPDGTIWPWLAVSGRNLLRDWQRRGAVEARARHRLGIPVSFEETSDPFACAEVSQLGERLSKGLKRLSPDQRTAIAARVLQGREYSEIATATGASEATVRGRVSRGLRAMQTFLQGGNS